MRLPPSFPVAGVRIRRLQVSRLPSQEAGRSTIARRWDSSDVISGAPAILSRDEAPAIEHDSEQSKPLVPLFVIIILLVVAIIAAVFATICCWRTRRRRDVREEDAVDASPTTPSNPTQEGHPVPTLVFQQHEPDTHGYFAPLYLDPAATTNAGAVDEEEAKRQLQRIYQPEMLQRKDTDSSDETTLVDGKDGKDDAKSYS